MKYIIFLMLFMNACSLELYSENSNRKECRDGCLKEGYFLATMYKNKCYCNTRFYEYDKLKSPIVNPEEKD